MAAEGLGAIIGRLGVAAGEAVNDEEKSRQYAAEYNLLRSPSAYEIVRIEEIKRHGRYCEKCVGLSECQYRGGDRGLEAVIMVNDMGGRLKGNRLYFGVKECRYLVEAEEKRKVELLRVESGLPERYKNKTKYDLNTREREVINRLLRGENKRLYISGGHRESEILLSIIGNEYLKTGMKVRYENALELLSELRVTNPLYHEKMEAMRGVEVLIIEGLREVSRYNDEQIGIIINSRNRLGKRSIVNGMRKLVEVGGMVGEQLESYEEMRINS